MSDLSGLRKRLEKRTSTTLNHVLLGQSGIYPGVAVGPLGLFSIQRVLAWDSDHVYLFSGWLRQIDKWPVSAVPIDFIPRPPSFYAKVRVGGRNLWVHRDFFQDLDQLRSLSSGGEAAS